MFVEKKVVDTLYMGSLYYVSALHMGVLRRRETLRELQILITKYQIILVIGNRRS